MVGQIQALAALLLVHIEWEAGWVPEPVSMFSRIDIFPSGESKHGYPVTWPVA